MGHLDVVEFLVECGANINARNNKTDKGQACTALHFAVLNQKEEAVRMLASLGARSDIAMNDGKTVEQLVSDKASFKKALDEGKQMYVELSVEEDKGVEQLWERARSLPPWEMLWRLYKQSSF